MPKKPLELLNDLFNEVDAKIKSKALSLSEGLRVAEAGYIEISNYTLSKNSVVQKKLINTEIFNDNKILPIVRDIRNIYYDNKTGNSKVLGGRVFYESRWKY